MAKLSIHNFHDLPKEQQKSIISELGENYNPAYFAGDDLNNVNTEVVTDEDGTLYDVRVFDPFHNVEGDTYIGPDGWSYWLLAYTDPEGNDIDTILANQECNDMNTALDYGYSIMDGRQEIEHFDTYNEALAYVSRTDNDYTELNIADTEAVLQWHEIYD